MGKNKKILFAYFVFLLILSSIVYSALNKDYSEDAILKRDGDFYIPIDSPSNIENISENKSLNFIKSKKEVKKHDLIVFIHGTIMALPSASGLIRTLKGNSRARLGKNKRSFYYKYLNNIRFKYFYKYQPIDDLNLRSANLTARKKVKQINKKSTRKIISSFNSFYNNDKNNLVSYYTFGWSGNLSQKSRTRWSEKLYVALIEKIKKINDQGDYANVTILAHSHGGNVALKLANIEKKYKKNLKIKNLILFGTPIQKETADLIYSDIFDSIYNIYSRGDLIQVIDIFSTKGFSKRKFHRKNGKFPAKLFQLEVICDKLKPMHHELWFIKDYWNLMYRKRLSVAPYPISVFSPEIIKIINKHYPDSVNLQLNIKRKNKKFCFKYKDLDKAKNKYECFVDFPNG